MFLDMLWIVFMEKGGGMGHIILVKENDITLTASFLFSLKPTTWGMKRLTGLINHARDTVDQSQDRI